MTKYNETFQRAINKMQGLGPLTDEELEQLLKDIEFDKRVEIWMEAQDIKKEMFNEQMEREDED